MAYEEVIYEVENGVATVTLNRPDRLNAWTPTMDVEIKDAMLAAEADESVRVILLTGAGRGFCAGADLQILGQAFSTGPDKQLLTDPGPAGKARREGVRPDFLKRHSFFVSIPKPVIAVVNGAAAGLGMILPMFCDLRFASDQAKFTTAFSQRGLIAEYGLAWILPRMIGVGPALDLLYSSRKVEAEEALRLGLVDRVFPHESLMSEARQYAEMLATTASPRSMRVMKDQVWNGFFQTALEAIEVSEDEMMASLQSEDFREGVMHFMEKRAPKFTGK